MDLGRIACSFQRRVFSKSHTCLGNIDRSGKVPERLKVDREVAEQFPQFFELVFVSGGNEQRLLHLEVSVTRGTSKDPTIPNEEPDVHSIPSSFKMTTLTA